MKKICAWCGKVIAPPASDAKDTTHGICPDCRKAFFASGSPKEQVPAALEPEPETSKIADVGSI